MNNDQETIESLLDELYDIMDRGTHLIFTGGKALVDAEEAKQILDEIRDVIPEEIRKARAIVADRDQILSSAQREGETVIRVAEEKAAALVNQEEIVRQAQAKANDLILQGQSKFREMRKASNDYIDDLMRRSDDALAETLAELRKTRQNIRNAQRNG